MSVPTLPPEHCTDPHIHNPHRWTEDDEPRDCPGTSHLSQGLVAAHWGCIPQHIVITEEDPVNNPEHTSPVMPPVEGDQYQDRSGDIWRVQGDGRLWCVGSPLPTTRGLVEMGELSRMYGPLTRVPESERLPYQPPEDYAPVGAAYRDADWDHWYRREDGRWALNRLLHEQFEEVDRLYGPLTRAQDADVVSAAARHPKEGGTPPRWGVRGEALTEAAEVVKTSATIASSDDLIRLAEWLMGGDQ